MNIWPAPQLGQRRRQPRKSAGLSGRSVSAVMGRGLTDLEIGVLAKHPEPTEFRSLYQSFDPLRQIAAPQGRRHSVPDVRSAIFFYRKRRISEVSAFESHNWHKNTPCKYRDRPLWQTKPERNLT